MKARSITRLLAVALVAACDRGSPPAKDSAAPVAAPKADVPWVNELGPMLAIPGDTERSAIVLFPQTPPDQPMVAALMRTAGDSTFASRIAIDAESQVCDGALAAHLTGATPSDWTIAFAPTVTSVRLDSIESLTPADSARLAADVARLASTVSSDKESRFAGLPFAVLAAHRVTLGKSTIVVGRVARRIPQEATPLEERTLLVGERADTGAFALKYSLRSTGAEDVVEHYALLGIVRSGAAHYVIVESEREGGTRYEIIERSADGAWRLRWSRQLSC